MHVARALFFYVILSAQLWGQVGSTSGYWEFLPPGECGFIVTVKTECAGMIGYGTGWATEYGVITAAHGLEFHGMVAERAAVKWPNGMISIYSPSAMRCDYAGDVALLVGAVPEGIPLLKLAEVIPKKGDEVEVIGLGV